MKRVSRWMVAIFTLALVSAMGTPAQTRRVTVKFKPGSSGATYKNSVTGYATVDFVVKTNAGQTMSVKLTSSNSSIYFSLRKAGGDEAISDSASDATEWSGQLPDTGEYVVRVYLYRNAARTTKKPVAFSLRIDVK